MPTALRDKRILITGVAGFVGSNLARTLLRFGAEVHGVLRPTSNPWRLNKVDPEDLDLSGPDLEIHRVDLRQRETLRQLFLQIQPHIVFHCAIYGIDPARRDRGEMVASNVLGAHHLIEAAREVEIERLVVTGGSSEYGHQDQPMRETDLPQPITLYGATKAAATLLFQQAAREIKLPTVILRLFSVYGYDEPHHRLIPTAFRAAFEGLILPLTVGAWRRDFIFIEDVVEACCAAATSPLVAGELLNIGGGRQYSNEEVVTLIDRLTGGGLRIERGAYPPHASDMRSWVADLTKTNQVLGWHPRHDLEQGLRKTLNRLLRARRAHASS